MGIFFYVRTPYCKHYDRYPTRSKAYLYKIKCNLMKYLKIESSSLMTYLLIIACLLSCNKGETQVTSLNISTDSLFFPATGGKTSVTITCNTAWSIIKESDWCIPDTFSAEGIRIVDINVMANKSTSDRSTILTISANLLNRKINVFQKGIVSIQNPDSSSMNVADTTNISYDIPPDNTGIRSLTASDLI